MVALDGLAGADLLDLGLLLVVDVVAGDIEGGQCPLVLGGILKLLKLLVEASGGGVMRVLPSVGAKQQGSWLLMSPSWPH